MKYTHATRANKMEEWRITIVGSRGVPLVGAQLGRVLPSDAPDGVSGGRVQSDGGSSDGVWHFHKKNLDVLDF